MKTQLITKRKLQQSITHYVLISLLILAVGGYFAYRNYTEYQTTRSAFDSETTQLAQLKVASDKSNTDYLDLKKSLDTQNSGVNQSIDKILPPTEDFTTLARDLDKYFLNTTGQTFSLFLSDIRFNMPHVDGQSAFGVLPFTMSISGSDGGFREFLNYIEKTGDLNDQSRLLNIQSMNFSYDNSGNGDAAISPVKNINASLNMNAYFQRPAADDKNSK